MAQRKVHLMKYEFPEDVKIPSLNYLIGRSVSWEQAYSMDSETGEAFAGTILGFEEEYVTVQLDNEETWDFHVSLFIHAEPADVQRAIFNRHCAINHKHYLERKQDKPHEIYALADPRNKAVRYVGMSNNAQIRYEQHILAHSDNEEKDAWILELRGLGLTPELLVLEKVKGRITAFQREQFWIGHYIAQGASLTNKLKEIEV